MRTSVVDKYIKTVKPDQKLYSRWLRNYGTEVQILKPKKREMENYVISYGASSSTFERIPKWYDFKIGYASVDALDFSRPENVHDSDVFIHFSEDGELGSGDLVQFSKNNKIYTYQVDIVENYHNFLYRTVLRSLDVENKPKEENKEGRTNEVPIF